MQLDAFSILLFGFFSKASLAALFLIFWLKDRPGSVWFAWWSATFVLGAMSALVFLTNGFAGEFFSVGLGTALVIAAFACCWQGARAFDGRPPLWLSVLLLPGAWLALSLVPGFVTNTAYRVVVSSLLIAPLLAMSAVEFWRGRQEPLQSRWPVIILFATFAFFFAARVPLIDVLPFPFGALPLEVGWIAAFNLALFFHSLMLTVLFVAMSKERLELDQRTKAQTDPLTGALNRRAFIARGGRLLSQHQDGAAPLCLLFLDVDHFKLLNDRFGHSGGDDVLIRFVAVVHKNIGPADLLFRIGGEEFCCLLPYTNKEQARRVAERIRQEFEMTTVDVAGTPVRATVSLGIASTETFGHDLDTLMRKADMAVYAAKRQGRNRVVVAASEDLTSVGLCPAIVETRMAPAA